MGWDLVVNLLGFLLIALVVYMVVKQVILPRVRKPPVPRRDRADLRARAERLLDQENLDPDDRHIIERALGTLDMGNYQGDGWSRNDPATAAWQDLQEVVERHERT
jgi:hypothetical protein